MSLFRCIWEAGLLQPPVPPADAVLLTVHTVETERNDWLVERKHVKHK